MMERAGKKMQATTIGNFGNKIISHWRFTAEPYFKDVGICPSKSGSGRSRLCSQRLGVQQCKGYETMDLFVVRHSINAQIPD